MVVLCLSPVFGRVENVDGGCEKTKSSDSAAFCLISLEIDLYANPPEADGNFHARLHW